MKKIILTLVLALGLAAAPAAQAQLRFGLKVGMNVNKLHFNESVFDSDNSSGFTGGAMMEFTLPFGIGMDASVMYVRRNTKFMVENEIEKSHRDYINIPINLKWKIGIPMVSKLICPFITTGPDFAFLTSKKSFDDFVNKKCDVAWNFGAGVELLRHLQVAASYGIGLNKAVGTTNSKVEGKDRYWTITAAYLF